MNAKEFEDFLRKNSACEDSEPFTEGKGLQECILSTQRADWLVWLFVKLHEPKKYSEEHKQLLKAIILCAMYAQKKMTKEALESLEVFERFVNGKATKEEFGMAADDALNSAIYCDTNASKIVADICVACVNSNFYDIAFYSSRSVCYAAISADTDMMTRLKEMATKIRPILFPKYKTK